MSHFCSLASVSFGIGSLVAYVTRNLRLEARNFVVQVQKQDLPPRIHREPCHATPRHTIPRYSARQRDEYSFVSPLSNNHARLLHGCHSTIEGCLRSNRTIGRKLKIGCKILEDSFLRDRLRSYFNSNRHIPLYVSSCYN